MPNTTNNNWPTPADTDLVKNGADAIRDLGNAIDTTLGVYSPVTPGLVKLSTVTFSGVTASSFPANIFSSTYTNYRLIVNLTSVTADNDSFVRLRSAGTDSTSAIYGGAIMFFNQTGGQGSASLGSTATSWQVSYMAAANNSGKFVLDIFDPFTAEQTGATTHGVRQDSTTNGACEMRIGTLSYGATTSFDSLTVGRLSGNMTGEMSIYGYSK